MAILFLIGRIIFGGYFIYTAFNHFRHLSGYSAYAESKGVKNGKAAVIATGIMLAVGGLSVVLGLYIVLGMWLLVLFLLPTTFIMHAFWKAADPMMRQGEQVNFFKNLALVGALLMMSALFALLG